MLIQLLLQFDSVNAHLSQEDMVSVLLMSLSVQLLPPSCNDLSSEDSNFSDFTSDGAASCFQHLVFLKSSYNYQIPVPHIYRKVMISEELYCVILTEVIFEPINNQFIFPILIQANPIQLNFFVFFFIPQPYTRFRQF